jgi:hypothetical protein
MTLVGGLSGKVRPPVPPNPWPTVLPGSFDVIAKN